MGISLFQAKGHYNHKVHIPVLSSFTLCLSEQQSAISITDHTDVCAVHWFSLLYDLVEIQIQTKFPRIGNSKLLWTDVSRMKNSLHIFSSGFTVTSFAAFSPSAEV